MSNLPQRLAAVLAADDNFGLPLTVALVSLLERARSRPLRVFVFDCGMREATRRVVEQSVAPVLGAHELRWVAPPRERLENLPLGVLPTSTTWARLLVPDLLREEARALYLDADTVVLADVAELFDLPYDGKPVLAVRDQNGWIGSKMFQIPDLAAFGVPPDAPAFNAGVLMLDLEAWRREGAAEKMTSLARANERAMLLADQNAINLTMHGRIGELDRRWNVQPLYRRIRSGEWNDIPTLPVFDGEPAILHFLSEEKPWQPGCGVPFRGEFYRVWARTKWPIPNAIRGDAEALGIALDSLVSTD